MCEASTYVDVAAHDGHTSVSSAVHHHDQAFGVKIGAPILATETRSRVRASLHLSPMAHPAPPRTPLRRVSQNSLFRLSRSHNDADAPTGLGFLAPALAELADEAEALHGAAAGLAGLADSLARFNDAFASFLYVMDMNALTVEWSQVRDSAR